VDVGSGRSRAAISSASRPGREVDEAVAAVVTRWGRAVRNVCLSWARVLLG